MAIAFYSLGTFDVTGLVERKVSPSDRENWKVWIWDQYAGKFGAILAAAAAAAAALTIVRV
jgi:hypothetical protein